MFGAGSSADRGSRNDGLTGQKKRPRTYARSGAERRRPKSVSQALTWSFPCPDVAFRSARMPAPSNICSQRLVVSMERTKFLDRARRKPSSMQFRPDCSRLQVADTQTAGSLENPPTSQADKSTFILGRLNSMILFSWSRQR